MRMLDVSSVDFLDMTEGATFNRVSFGGASVSFQVPVARFSACPFDDGEVVKVVWRGKTLLIGPVINPQHSLEGDSEYWAVTIYDYWWYLDNIIYFENGRAAGVYSRYSRSASVSGEGTVQATVKLSSAFKGVLDHAITTALVPISYDLRLGDEAEMIPFAYSSESYASLLVQIQKWRPNMSCWFEYGEDDSAKLVIADHDQLTDVVLDLSSVDVSTLSLKARPDLVPPAVGLVCKAVVSEAQRALSVYPPGESLSQPYTVTAEIDVPYGSEVEDEDGNKANAGSLSYDTPRVIVRGKKFPTVKAQWIETLKRWAPALNDCANLEVADWEVTGTTPADTQHAGYSSGAITHELISGAINGKSGRIKWGLARVDIKVRATEPPDTVKQYFPTYGGRVEKGHRWIGALTFEVITTNVNYASYRVDRKGTVESVSEADDEGGGEEEKTYNITGLYSGLLKSYYDATRVLPYDGRVTVHDDFDHVCGGSLSISGGLSEWETMRAQIQEVELDLESGVSDVTIGAPEHLSLQDAVEKSRQIAETLNKTAKQDDDSTSTFSGSGSSGSGSGNEGNGVAELPTVTPYVKLLQAPEPAAWGSNSVDVGFQCRLKFETDGTKSGAYIKQGYAIYAGQYIGGLLPSGGNGGWVESPVSEGEVWLQIQLTTEGEFASASLSAAGGVSDPVKLCDDPAREDNYVYWFHLASISGDKVVQHAAGTVYLTIHPGTFGPAGMA